MKTTKVIRRDAVYRDNVREEHRNNPLVRAMPDFLSEAEYEKKRSYKTSLTSDLFDLATDDALVDIEKLKFLYITTTKTYQLYKHVYVQMKLFYGQISALDAEYNEFRQEILKALKEKEEFKEDRYSPYHALSPSILVSGHPGTGKTVNIRQTLRLFDQVQRHKKFNGHVFKLEQVVWLSFDMNVSRSKKALVDNFFSELERILGRPVRKDFLTSRDTQDQLLLKMQAAAIVFNIGIIHIDEVQFALNRKKSDKETPTIPELEALFNQVGVPIILSTTVDALNQFTKGTSVFDGQTTALQTSRRIASVADIELGLWPASASYTNELLNLLYPPTLFKGKHAIDESFKRGLLTLSAGVPDIFVKLSIAFIRNWYEKLLRNGSDIDINMLKMLCSVYKVRGKIWEGKLEELRQQYVVGAFPEPQSTNHEPDVHEAIAQASKRKRTTKHAPKAAKSVERIDEGEANIDPASIILNYGKRPNDV